MELLEINITNHTYTYRANDEVITESLTKMPDYDAFVNGATKDWVTL